MLEFGGGAVPFEGVHFVEAGPGGEVREGGIVEEGVDLVGHRIHIPEVHLEGVLQDLGGAGLLGNDGRDAGPHRLEGRDAERLGDGRHDVHVREGEHLLHVGPAEEAREVEAVGNAQPGGVADAAVHHVAAAGHHEADVLGALEHLRGQLR